MLTHLRRHTVGGLVLAVSMVQVEASQAATSPTIVQAGITLSNFAYKVTDLDTSDGIAANATFDTSGTGFQTGAGIALNIYDALDKATVNPTSTQFVAGNPFSVQVNGTYTVPNITASLSIKGSTFNAAASNNLADLTDFINKQPSIITTSSEFDRYASMDEFPIYVTLSAHSSITFSGTVSGSTSVLPNLITETTAFNQIAASQASLTVSSASNMSVGLQDINLPIEPLPTDGPQYVGINGYSASTIDSAGHVTNDDAVLTSQPFTLQFSNTSDHAVTKELVFSLSSYTSFMITSVPEPSSMLLMGLGLVGVLTTAKSRTKADNNRRGV